MDKAELIKELEGLRDIKCYSKKPLLNAVYRAALLAAIDLAKNLTITVKPILIEESKVIKTNPVLIKKAAF
tara:strand:- start:429 stop:641 length:213 start_codon:yes stop_codon:yes gene_type:complete